MDRAPLIEMIDRFIAGPDRSMAAAQTIGVALEDCFPDDDDIQETVIALALYTPGGGQYLLDEAEIVVALGHARRRIAAYRAAT